MGMCSAQDCVAAAAQTGPQDRKAIGVLARLGAEDPEGEPVRRGAERTGSRTCHVSQVLVRDRSALTVVLPVHGPNRTSSDRPGRSWASVRARGWLQCGRTSCKRKSGESGQMCADDDGTSLTTCALRREASTRTVPRCSAGRIGCRRCPGMPRRFPSSRRHPDNRRAPYATPIWGAWERSLHLLLGWRAPRPPVSRSPSP
jgi:hypothetical protein